MNGFCGAIVAGIGFAFAGAPEEAGSDVAGPGLTGSADATAAVAPSAQTASAADRRTMCEGVMGLQRGVIRCR